MPAPTHNWKGEPRTRRPPQAKRSPVITVRLRPELVDAAKALKGVRSFGWVISEALEQWVERQEANNAGPR